MFVVSVTHKSAMWGQCYGPFDTYHEANEYWKENYGGPQYRTSVYEVIAPCG